MNEEALRTRKFVILRRNNCNGQLNVRQVRARKLKTLGGLNLVFINGARLMVSATRLELSQGIFLELLVLLARRIIICW